MTNSAFIRKTMEYNANIDININDIIYMYICFSISQH